MSPTNYVVPTHSELPPNFTFVHDALKPLIYVHAYVCALVLILIFLVALGPLRRHRHQWWIKFLVWAAYIASTIVTANAIGQMQSSSYRGVSFNFWAVFALLVLASVDSISVYSLNECEDRMRYVGDVMFLAASVSWMVYVHKPEAKLMGPLFLLWLLTLIKAVERAYILAMSSRDFGLVRDTKLTADFMSYEHDLSPQVQPNSMRGYKYLVKWPSRCVREVEITPPDYQERLRITQSVVTVEKIWECRGRLLSSEGDRNGQRKDICLSYALFNILRCRIAGYCLPEYHRQTKNWDLFRHLLFSNGGDDQSHERAFQVIETELHFLYEFFYTKYPLVTKPLYLITIRFFEIITVVVGCLAAASHLNFKHLVTAEGYSILAKTFKEQWIAVDFVITSIVIATILILEAVQLLFIIFSDWMKINCLCAYVQNPSCQNNIFIEKTMQIICSKWWKPWDRKLGQYSVLESFNRNPLFLAITHPVCFLTEVPRKGQKESERIVVPAEVKKAIINWLRYYIDHPQEKLTNGIGSLGRHHGVLENLRTACGPGVRNQTRILVWHIATSLCEMKLAEFEELRRSEHFVVATTLSRYCAYLVAFAPKLLPDYPYYVTQFIFDQVISEARDKLNGQKSLTERYQKMMELSESVQHDDQKILVMGAKLGKELIRIEDRELVWRALADFWAELMLFLSLSDEVTYHEERLASGGEFITQLRALLFHAWIHRDPPSHAAGIIPGEHSWRMLFNRQHCTWV